MLLIEYANLYNYQIMLKVVLYSIKLKMEFYILYTLARSLRENAAMNGKSANFSTQMGGKELIPAAVTSAHKDSRVIDQSKVESSIDTQQ